MLFVSTVVMMAGSGMALRGPEGRRPCPYDRNSYYARVFTEGEPSSLHALPHSSFRTHARSVIVAVRHMEEQNKRALRYFGRGLV